MFYRPSWSPDGSLLIAGNGVKKNKHIAPIFQRDKEFITDREFKGHKDTIIVAVSWHVTFIAKNMARNTIL